MSDDLKLLKARRRALISEYGRLGEKHPMGRGIGGLNPAAMELHSLRGEIARLEAANPKRKRPLPELRPIPGMRGRTEGWFYDVSLDSHHGKIGSQGLHSNPWYVVVDGEIVADKLATKLKARDAFVAYVQGRD